MALQPIVVALGGNALIRTKQLETYDDQIETTMTTARVLLSLFDHGYLPVVTHGNGPQVGNLLIQHHSANCEVPCLPLDVCVAQSQGQIGYLLQLCLQRVAMFCGRSHNGIVTLVTQVEVDPRDPAFSKPIKPVGPFYNESEKKDLEQSRGWVMQEDAGRGYRQVVVSPLPKRIVELNEIQKMIDMGVLVICCGGGGVPIVYNLDILCGVEAVIDKDHVSTLLANELNIETLVILTSVPNVYLNYGTDEQYELNRVTLGDMCFFLRQGHFSAGSMKPKVEAAIRFIERGGGQAIITNFEGLIPALNGNAGTIIRC